jgi:glycerol-3-phosphate acyltransferase PlsX
MGGDYSPRDAIKAAVESVADYPIDIALVGKKPVLEMLLRKQKDKGRISIVDASEVVEENEDAIQAVQNKPDSSVAVAARMIKEGKAAGFVSVGSTGAAVVAAFLNLPMVPGIERGALCAVIDVNQPKPCCIIDCGVNPNCQPHTFSTCGTAQQRGGGEKRQLSDQGNPPALEANGRVKFHREC